MKILIPDIINGLCELGGSIAAIANCIRLRKDKEIKGVSWGSYVFYTMWAYWNLYYYFHLDQIFSFLAGVSIACWNTYWIYLIVKYRKLK